MFPAFKVYLHRIDADVIFYVLQRCLLMQFYLLRINADVTFLQFMLLQLFLSRNLYY